MSANQLYLAQNFRVEIDGITNAIFSECSGLEWQTDIHEYQEGGENYRIHKLVGQTRYRNIVLRKGFVDNRELWEWMETFADEGQPPQRKSGSIVMCDSQGNEIIRWNFVNGWPSKWEGPDLDANAEAVAIESLEIAHEGISQV